MLKLFFLLWMVLVPAITWAQSCGDEAQSSGQLRQNNWSQIFAAGGVPNDATDDSAAFAAVLARGNLCLPNGTWQLDSATLIPDGRYIIGETRNGVIIECKNGSGTYCLSILDNGTAGGGGIINATIQTSVTGANGVKCSECRRTYWRSVTIDGNDAGSIGFLLDGATKGSTFNTFHDVFTIDWTNVAFRCDTTAGSVPWCNRNWFDITADSSTTGFEIKDGDTNFGRVAAQDNTTNVRLQADGNNNHLIVALENGTTDLDLDTGATENFIMGSMDPTKVTDQGTRTTLIIDGEGFRAPGYTQSTLPSAFNGTMVYCTDCTAASAPCTGAGSGTMAFRVNGAWNCF